MGESSTVDLPMAYSLKSLSCVLGVASVVVLIGALIALYLLYQNRDRPWRNKFIVAWILGPPIYFLINYHVLYRYFGNPGPGAYEHYVRSQEVFTPMWAAIGTFAVLIASGTLGPDD